MSNDDLIKDKCALTQLLETQCHDKTHSIGFYHYEPLKCHREGLEEYRAHRETFVDTIGGAFFHELSTWLNTGKTSMEEFKANFDWGSVGTMVKDGLSWLISIRFR